MTEKIVASESPSESPQEIVLSLDEWTEIEDSLIALHAGKAVRL